MTIPSAAPTRSITSGRVQPFQNGALYGASSGTQAGKVYLVRGLIATKYNTLGAGRGQLGLPSSDEFTTGGKRHQVTDGFSDALSVAFDRGGKYLYFLTSTDAGPATMAGMSTYNRGVTRGANLIVLNKDAPSPLAPESDEEDRLADRRLLLQNAERLAETITEAIGELDGEHGAQQGLARALRRLERARDRAQGLLDAAVAIPKTGRKAIICGAVSPMDEPDGGGRAALLVFLDITGWHQLESHHRRARHSNPGDRASQQLRIRRAQRLQPRHEPGGDAGRGADPAAGGGGGGEHLRV